MTLADGGLVNIVVPSRGPICAESDLPAVHREEPCAELTPKDRIGVGNSPPIVATAMGCDAPRPASRTTIA